MTPASVRPVQLAFVILALAVAGCGRARRLLPDDSAQEGRQIYLRACASCHGEDGRGDGPLAGGLPVPPPDLTTLSSRHGGEFPRAYVIDVMTGEREFVAHGTREMPIWNQHFGPEGAADAAALYARRRLELLATYLASMQRQR